MASGVTINGVGWRDAAILAVAVIVVQAGVYAGVAWMIPNLAARGQFGDAFGVTNALFSGLAVAGLICTLILQQVQMRSQRAESDSIRTEAAATLAVQQRSTHLNALTFLMGYYDDRLAHLADRNAAGPAGAELLRERNTYAARRAEMERIIAGLHGVVVAGLGEQHVR